mmetsp:Transcript_12086/g.24991  ORF Transcript_12086/g.24991 Transcript_12086/m.24991 type:complete len:320 (-) Transcript_12086:3554-4513(-)
MKIKVSPLLCHSPPSDNEEKQQNRSKRELPPIYISSMYTMIEHQDGGPIASPASADEDAAKDNKMKLPQSIHDCIQIISSVSCVDPGFPSEERDGNDLTAIREALRKIAIELKSDQDFVYNFVGMGGIKKTISILKQYPNLSLLQRSGMCVLSRIVKAVPKFDKVIHMQGGTQVALRAIRSFPTNRIVKVNGFGLMLSVLNCIAMPELRSVCQDLLPLVGRALVDEWDHHKTHIGGAGGEQACPKTKCAKLLWKISATPRGRKWILETDEIVHGVCHVLLQSTTSQKKNDWMTLHLRILKNHAKIEWCCSQIDGSVPSF